MRAEEGRFAVSAFRLGWQLLASGRSTTDLRGGIVSPPDFPESGRQTFRNSHPLVGARQWSRGGPASV